MRTYVLALFLVDLVTGQLSLRGDQECGDNQEFNTCGSACEPSCDNPSPSFCTLQCVIGCQCVTGYIRNAAKECVLQEDCNKVDSTSTSQAVEEVGSSTSTTVSTSSEPVTVPVTTVDPCSTVACSENQLCQLENVTCVVAPCIPIASCVELSSSATVASQDIANSVPLVTEISEDVETEIPETATEVVIEIVSENSTTCGANEEYTDCYKACDETLCNGTKSIYYCPDTCSAGCQCKTGYVRSSDGLCYLPEDCQDVQCSGLRNEEWGCTDCEASCTSTSTNSTCDVSTCSKSCVCHKGFARVNGTCVSYANCPDVTIDNITCTGAEQYTTCMPTCQLTCHGVQTCTGTTAAPTSTNSTCQAGCVCRNGYKRDAFGECKHVQHCHKTTVCDENETYSKCLPEETKCAKTGGNVTHPKFRKCYSGCACDSGYARSTSGICVLEANC